MKGNIVTMDLSYAQLSSAADPVRHALFCTSRFREKDRSTLLTSSTTRVYFLIQASSQVIHSTLTRADSGI